MPSSSGSKGPRHVVRFPAGDVFCRTVRPHRLTRTHRPHLDLQSAASACSARGICSALQRSTAAPCPCLSPTATDPSRRGSQPRTHHAPISFGWSDQRVRTSGIKTAFTLGGQVLEPQRLRRSADVRETRQSTRRTHTVTGRSQVVSTPELHWYAAGVGDGATHKGVWLPGGGSGRSLCGIEFVPLPIDWPARRGPRPATHLTRSRSPAVSRAGPVRRTWLVVLFDSEDQLVRPRVTSMTPRGGGIDTTSAQHRNSQPVERSPAPGFK
jgi:hypothetical protein